MKRQEIVDFVSNRNEIYNKISELIGYGSNMTDQSLIDMTSRKWKTEDGNLYIQDGEECIYYVISSYSAAGEKLYIGESDGISYIMAYDEEGYAEDSQVFIFDTSLRDDNLELGW